MKEWEQFLERAEESFAAATLLLDHGFADFAASRTYFGWFYIATALLDARGAKFKKHSAVVAQFGFTFTRTHLLDPRFHQRLITAGLLREQADYYPSPEINADDVAALVAQGREFLAAARGYLASQPGR